MARGGRGKKRSATHAAKPPAGRRRVSENSTPLKQVDILDAEDFSLMTGRTWTPKPLMQKLIQDNFLNHGFTAAEVQTAQCADGKCLTERLEEDRKLWEAKELVMGPKCYEVFRVECRNPHSSFSCLRPTTAVPVEEDHTELEDAPVCALQKRRDLQPLEEWRASRATCSESDLCALFRAIPMVLPMDIIGQRYAGGKRFDVCSEGQDA